MVNCLEEAPVNEITDRIRANIHAGDYEHAYSIAHGALQDTQTNRKEVIAVLCELTARLRAYCMDLAIRKMDFGPDYGARENLLRKANEFTGEDIYGRKK
jgi:hypothetical protein